MALDPADPDSAYVIPLRGRRRPRDARRAGARVRDARRGRDLDAARRGPARPSDAYLTVLRQAFDRAGEGAGLELYFGATSGDGVRLGRRRRELVHRGRAPAAGVLGPGDAVTRGRPAARIAPRGVRALPAPVPRGGRADLERPGRDAGQAGGVGRPRGHDNREVVAAADEVLRIARRWAASPSCRASRRSGAPTVRCGPRCGRGA